MKLRAFLPAVIAATCILAPSAAQAFTFQIGPNSEFSNSEPTGASVRLNFDFTQNGDDVLLNLGIFNTTGEIEPFGSGATEATLTKVAFDFASSVAFGALAYDPLESTFGTLYRDVDVNPFSSRDRENVGSFDVGIGLNPSGNGGNGRGSSQGNNPQGGLTAGNQTQVQFAFSPSTAGTSLAANDFAQAFEREIRSGNLNVAARFQQVNGSGSNSDTLMGGRVISSDRPTQVPEPAAIGALGLTAAGLGLLKKKQAADASDQGASV